MTPRPRHIILAFTVYVTILLITLVLSTNPPWVAWINATIATSIAAYWLTTRTRP